MTIDAERLRRAVHLRVERIADGRYLVDGGAMPHVVDLDDGRCDCADARLRGARCKHLIAARLSEADADVLEALRQLVPATPTPAPAQSPAHRRARAVDCNAMARETRGAESFRKCNSGNEIGGVKEISGRATPATSVPVSRALRQTETRGFRDEGR